MSFLFLTRLRIVDFLFVWYSLFQRQISLKIDSKNNMLEESDISNSPKGSDASFHGHNQSQNKTSQSHDEHPHDKKESAKELEISNSIMCQMMYRMRIHVYVILK